MPKLEQIPSAPSHKGGRRARSVRVSSSLAEINVVPLVDVMLVLLVIFMVAAPMMQQGYEVDLPQSRQSRPIESPVTVSIPLAFRETGRVMIDGEEIEFALLAERARQAVDAREQKAVILAGDGGITYNELMQVFDELQSAGITQVAMQTEPATGRR
jgi:biopolymer transport protein TolR